MKKSGITKTQIEQIFPDGKKLKESQKKIGAILIRYFGVRRSMREVDTHYVQYCLYGTVSNVSLEKLMACNRKMVELTEGLTFRDIMEQAFDGEDVRVGTWYKKS